LTALTILTNEERDILEKATRRVVIDYYKEHSLNSPESLRRLLKHGMGGIINVPEKINCKTEGHCAPFDFVYDVLINNVSDYIVWANRSGSKTFYAGFITWLQSYFYNKLETNFLGGSETQSNKAYEAFSDFWDITDMDRSCLKKPPMISSTIWKNGSKVNILTASERSVRGPHTQRLIMDEVDEMDESIHESALSQTQEKYGISGGVGELSTNHKLTGVMSQSIERAEVSGKKIYKWCIWECLESCKDYECSTCQLTSWCPGVHMKEATGYYKINDFIQKLKDLSLRTIQIEWFCLKPGATDLVYLNEFNEDIHFISASFNPSKQVVLSIDWGGTNPFAIGVWQENQELGWVQVDEVYMSNTMNSLIIEECQKRPWWKYIKEGIADPARSDLIREWQAKGINIVGANNDVDPGIEAVKNALAPVLGNPKIYFNKYRCKNTRNEFYSYSQKNGKIKKEHDHSMDQIRYFVMTKLNKPNIKTEAFKREQYENRSFFQKNKDDD